MVYASLIGHPAQFELRMFNVSFLCDSQELMLLWRLAHSHASVPQSMLLTLAHQHLSFYKFVRAGTLERETLEKFRCQSVSLSNSTLLNPHSQHVRCHSGCSVPP